LGGGVAPPPLDFILIKSFLAEEKLGDLTSLIIYTGIGLLLGFIVLILLWGIPIFIQAKDYIEIIDSKSKKKI